MMNWTDHDQTLDVIARSTRAAGGGIVMDNLGGHMYRVLAFSTGESFDVSLRLGRKGVGTIIKWKIERVT